MRRVIGLLRAFMAANRRLAQAIERRLPQAREDLQAAYRRAIEERMNAHQGQLVVDVGGGRRCHFADLRDPALGTRIVAVDISAEELEHNWDVDEKRVADVQRELPFEDGEVDLIVSRSVLEHLEDVEAFVRESARVLKSGGYAIHMLPSKFSPHSIANQLLPRSLSKRAVHFFVPGSEGRLGFPAYYDRCYPAALRRLLERHGFAVEELRPDYYQSDYYDSFLPAYLLSAAYELAVRALRLENLAASLLVVARKR